MWKINFTKLINILVYNLIMNNPIYDWWVFLAANGTTTAPVLRVSI